jgi:hypothetical protein
VPRGLRQHREALDPDGPEAVVEGGGVLHPEDEEVPELDFINPFFCCNVLPKNDFKSF